MKNNTLTRFSNTELQDLDAFLRRQTSNMSLVKAHGFITAIVSFPDLFLPSEWIPILLGELNNGGSNNSNKLMLDRLITMYRQISDSLGSDKRFEFLFSADEPSLSIEQASYSHIQEWCNGYCLALVWNESEWLNVAEDYITQACATFFMITDLISNAKQGLRTKLSDKRYLVKNLPDLVKALYVYWLGKQDDMLFAAPQIHRDIICPCGSTRNYYDCCWIELSEAVIH
jgi:uncharacterized protein